MSLALNTPALTIGREKPSILWRFAGLFLAQAALILAMACGGGGGGGGGTVITNTAPAFTTQPANQTVNAGSAATFTVAASGTPTPTYAWQRSNDGGTTWTAVSGAATATYTFTVAKADHNARFRAVATNTVSPDATSTAATLSVQWLAIVTQPANASVTAGSTATFTVVADANPVATYQWQSSTNGTTWTNVSGGTGATTASYTTAATSLSNTGTQYRCALTNATGSINSTVGTLTVTAPIIAPAITTQPANANVTVGSPASFTVVATGTAPLSYQWKKGTTNVGTNSATLTIPAAAIADAGSYTVTVSNSASSVTSNPATLTVNAVPVITSFVAAKTTVTTGTATTLTAAFTGGTGSVNGIGAVTSGAAVPTGNLTANTTFTLTVTNASGTAVTQTVTVAVVAAPVATSLVASNATPAFGGTFTLTPTYSGGTGAIDNGVVCPASGLASAAITANWTGARTFTLTVTNVDNITATTSVTVTPQVVSVGAITPANPTRTASTTTTFSTTVTGGVLSTVTWTASAGAMNAATGVWTAPATAGSVTITATSVDDATKTNTTTVTVIDAPVATSLAASTATPAYGGTFTLTPTYSGGTGAIDNGVICPATGVASATIIANWTGPRTFTLTVSNTAGATDTKTVTVTPQVVSVGAISPANPTRTASTTTTFTTTVTGGVLGTVTWTASAGAMNATTGVWTAPAAAASVTITATSVDDSTKTNTTTVTVIDVPVATGLVTSNATPLFGSTFTLTPTYSGGTGAIDNSVVCPPTGLGSAAITANWTGARVFTLTVTNTAGATATTTVTVTPQVVSVGAITPANPTKTASTTTTFSTTVTGGVLGTVTWTASAGAMNATTGVWTAPAAAASVTITATSVDDSTKSNTTTVTVIDLPLATGLVASNATPAYGDTFTLTPTYSGGTGAIDNGVVCPATTIASAAIQANWTGARTFTLTVTNADNVTATTSVTVTPQVVSVGAITPATPTVNAGDTQVFSATATGGATNLVTWSSPSGSWTGNTWTAPSLAQTVTITATSADDPTKTATTTVTVVSVLPVFTANPLPQVWVPGNTATFNVVVSSPAAPILQIDWERSDNLGVNWYPVYTGTTNLSYTTEPLVAGYNGSLFRAIATNANGSTTSTAAGVNQVLTVTVNGTPIELVLVPAGSFTMGQTETLNSDDPKSTPSHPVTFAKSFYIAKYPCTQAQWVAIMGSNPSTYTVAGGGAPSDDLQRPVETVSFDDITAPATGFIAMLNTAATTKPAGSSFSLPSEAEFEYAIRAGSTGLNNYYFGAYDSGTTDLGVRALIDKYMWSNHNSLGITHAVGQKLPNAWGLFDMAGNVWSTCADDWHDSYSATGTGVPVLPLDGTAWVDTPRAANRAFRGGSFAHPEHYGQSKARGIDLPTLRSNSSGFRVVLHLP